MKAMDICFHITILRLLFFLLGKEYQELIMSDSMFISF